MNKLRSVSTWIARHPQYVCTAILVLSIILTALCLGMFLDTRLIALEEHFSTLSTQAVNTSPSDRETKFVLREHEGRIGVFLNDETSPCEILGVYVFTLPEADRAALKIGITVYGTDALRGIIEDFTG